MALQILSLDINFYIANGTGYEFSVTFQCDIGLLLLSTFQFVAEIKDAI